MHVPLCVCLPIYVCVCVYFRGGGGGGIKSFYEGGENKQKWERGIKNVKRF